MQTVRKFIWSLLALQTLAAQNVVTVNYDLARTNADPAETILTPKNVRLRKVELSQQQRARAWRRTPPD